MTSLEVLGVACIWCSVIFLSIIAALILLYVLGGLLDRYRLGRVIWSWKRRGWVRADELDDYVDDLVRDWYGAVRDERCWSRSGDFAAGAKAAARHMVRAHVPIRPATAAGERAARYERLLVHAVARLERAGDYEGYKSIEAAMRRVKT